MRRRRVRIRIRTFDAERRPSQCQRRPNADAERSPSASPPQRVDDIELLCDGGGRQQRASVAWALAVRSRPRVRGGSGWGRG